MSSDDLVEFYESNGIKLRDDNGNYCKLYLEQLASEGGYIWCYRDHCWKVG